MQITTKLRRTVTALGLTAIGVGTAFSSAPSASALITLVPGSVTTERVTILDYDNINHAASMPDPTQTGGGFLQLVANPDVFVDPPRIHANDQVAVCVTFNNPGFTTTPTTPYTITGPSYYLTGTVPALAHNAPITLCSGYYHLNFPSSAACNITLTAQPQGYPAKNSRNFTQATTRCPTPINRVYDSRIPNGNQVLVLDNNDVNNADIVNGSINDDSFVKPDRIHANDNVNICTTFSNPGYGVSATTPVIVSGRSYYASTTAPVLAAGQPQTVCTGFYHLNWQGAFPAPTAYPTPCGITLQATVGYAPSQLGGNLVVGQASFTQAGLMCTGSAPPPPPN